MKHLLSVKLTVAITSAIGSLLLVGVSYATVFSNDYLAPILQSDSISEYVIDSIIPDSNYISPDTAAITISDTIPADNQFSIDNEIVPSDSDHQEHDQSSTAIRDIFNMPETLADRYVFDILDLDAEKHLVSWSFNPIYLSYEEVPIDTSLWMNHLHLPQYALFEPFSHLGNIGSPSQYDHFFSRPTSSNFIFSEHYKPYWMKSLSHKHYNVRNPFTILHYSTGGQRRVAEQIFKVFHTQNVNPHLNFGVDFDNYTTKGKYMRQETRTNAYAFFLNYFKGNLSAQVSYAGNRSRNQESGGITDHSNISDTLIEPRLVPFYLSSTSMANSDTKGSFISTNVGYTLLNVRAMRKDTAGVRVPTYVPLLSTRLIVERSSESRSYTDENPFNPQLPFYPNYYISPRLTADSASHTTWDVLAMAEIAQFAKIPGMPGIRGWVGHQHQQYYHFEPSDFIYSRETPSHSTSHFGIGAYSHSPYLSYEGAIRLYIKGYRAEDKELYGRVRFSPWKDPEMPQLIGKASITEVEPNVFFKRYYSNHYQWDSRFDKEKRFRLEGALRIDRWWTEVGYNVMHISDFHYFNRDALPAQASNVTITSAYFQNRVQLFGINFVNRVVWQANTNTDVLSLPNLLLFSSLFYETVLVPNALTGQIGVSLFYRSRFYADAYAPSTGQFYNQRERLVGSYPYMDAFLNFKWKRAILFLKYEHANQGYPNYEFFATYRYPMEPSVLKYGVSWIFYD